MSNLPFEITEINIRFIPSRGNLVGFASVLLNNCIVLNSIGLHSKIGGRLDISFPAITHKNGTREFHHFPINEPARKIIEEAINRKYQELMSEEE